MGEETFRLHPGLHSITDNPEGVRARCLVVSTGVEPLVVDDDRLEWAIDQLWGREFTAGEAKELWSKRNDVDEVVDQLWAFCLEHELAVSSDTEHSLEIPRYHVATRNHPFLDMGRKAESVVEDNQLMQSFLASEAYPPVYKHFHAELAYELEDATHLETSQFWADPFQQYSLMLSGTFGVRRHVASYHDEMYGYSQVELIRKSIPSGGSKHPTEVLLSVESSEILERGLYHFDVKKNALVAVETPDAVPMLSEHQRARFGGATELVVVILFSVVERAMWRYRDSRSFRAILVDAGHAQGHLASLAGYLGWNYESLPLGDEAADSIAGLPIDSVDEPVVWMGVMWR